MVLIGRSPDGTQKLGMRKHSTRISREFRENASILGNKLFDPEVYRNYRFRDRPLVNTEWELVINQRDEFVNQDIDLQSLADVRVLIYYTEDKKLSAAEFWTQYGKEVYEKHKPLMKVSDEIKRAAAEATAGASSDEEKLDHLFDYVRSKVKNVYDVASGITGEQIEKMKNNKTPSDTLKRGAGNWHDIDMLFAALATASGFDARVAQMSNRADNFFDPAFPDSYFMRPPQGTEDIAVRVGDKWLFYDPGSTYVAKGMLHWQEEGQNALISDPKMPTFVKTPMSGPEKSLEKCTGTFKLSEDGALEGDVRIEYTGHLAADMKARNDDDSPAEREETLRKKFRERMADVEITDIKIENVTDPVKPFVYSFHVRVPGYAQRTGKRLFLQPAFFQKGSGSLFPTAERRPEIYFHYPWSEEDNVEFTLPEGFALDNADAPAAIDGGLSKYEPRAAITKDGRTLIYQRKFFFGKGGADALLFPTAVYPNLKAYFDQVNKADGHTIVLKQGAAGAAASGSTSN